MTKNLWQVSRESKTIFDDDSLGHWWLPGEAESNCFGTLKYDASEGLTLSLIGKWQGNPLTDVLQPPDNPVSMILGVVSGRLVTVCQAQWQNASATTTGLAKTNYRVYEAYFGSHLDPLPKLTFDKSVVQFTHLSDWLSDAGVFFHPSPTENEGGRLEIGYDVPPTEWESIEGGRLLFDHILQEQMGFDDAHVQVVPAFVIELDERLSVRDWYARFLQPIGNFLSFAVGQPVYVDYLNVTPNKAGQHPGVEVVVDRYVPPEQRDKRRLFPNDMLFVKRDLPASLGDIMSKWLLLNAELGSILGLYFSIGRSANQFMEFQFSSTIQALEGFHRRRFDGWALAPERHEERLEAILSIAPQDQRAWLAEKLAYSNEVSLAERLGDLIGASGGVLLPWIPNSRKRNTFLRAVVDTRNQLTHYVPDAHQRKLDGEKLFDLIEPLMILMRALLLKELGFTDDQVLKLFQRNKRYVRAVRRAQGLA